MFNRLWESLKLWFLSQRSTAERDVIRKQESKLKALIDSFDKQEKRLVGLLRQTQAITKACEEDLNDVLSQLQYAKTTAEQHRDTIEGLRTKLAIYEDVVVPGLDAANRMYLERYDAETSIQVRRKIGMQPGSED